MSNILVIVLKYLPFLIQASQSVPQITRFISELGATFERERLWTDENKAEFDKQTEDMREDLAWAGY